MSVVLATTFITVHLFGLTSKDVTYTPFASRAKCENHVELLANKAKRNPDNVIMVGPGKLHVSNKSDHKIQTYKCTEAS